MRARVRDEAWNAVFPGQPNPGVQEIADIYPSGRHYRFFFPLWWWDVEDLIMDAEPLCVDGTGGVVRARIRNEAWRAHYDTLPHPGVQDAVKVTSTGWYRFSTSPVFWTSEEVEVVEAESGPYIKVNGKWQRPVDPPIRTYSFGHLRQVLDYEGFPRRCLPEREAR